MYICLANFYLNMSPSQPDIDIARILPCWIRYSPTMMVYNDGIPRWYTYNDDDGIPRWYTKQSLQPSTQTLSTTQPSSTQTLSTTQLSSTQTLSTTQPSSTRTLSNTQPSSIETLSTTQTSSTHPVSSQQLNVTDEQSLSIQDATNGAAGDSWCYCRKGESVDDYMIGCDNAACLIQWFHLSCLHLTLEQVPKGNWLCPEC